MKTYIVGNWKLNFTVGESSVYLHKILKTIPSYRNLNIIIAPSMIALQPLSLQTDRHKIKLAAQNAYARDYGAFTGETSFPQLRGIADYCIIGTPERRHIFDESDKLIRDKVSAAIRNKITPILCLGETESERAFHETADVIRDQLLSGLTNVSEDDLDKIIIAYEPVWAVSTSRVSKLAAPDEISDVAKLIRATIAQTYSHKAAENIPIIFGGSVTSSNAGAYLTIPGINGLLLGSASLILNEFNDIIEIAKRVKS